MANTEFDRWLDTFVDEKGLDVDHVFTVETNDFWGTHMIPLSVVIEAAHNTTLDQQHSIKQTLVLIDFKNGDPMHFFAHLAKGLALAGAA
jgi:hypothetical protein